MFLTGSLRHVPLLFVILGGITGTAASGQIGGNLFTAAQAQRGKVVYTQFCATCHGESLSGGKAPPLSGQPFQVSWAHPAVTIDDLFYLFRVTMPPNAAKAIPLSDHAAVVAYLLQMNGFTPGGNALAPDAPALKQHFPWAGKYRSFMGRSADLTNPDSSKEDFVVGDAKVRPAPTGPTQATLNAADRSTDWLMHTHDYAGTRHSPLSQINAENARELRPVSMFQVAEVDNFQTGPLVHQGVMYLTTRVSTIALDAVTARPKWKYTWQPRGNTVWELNRGVAIKDGYVVRGTPDGFLLALNGATGDLVWARRVANSDIGETFTMAPMIYDDLVLIGPAGSENNIRGSVSAYRLRDGTEVWRFNCIPGPGEPGYETWRNPKNIPMGGGAVWTAFSLDSETGELHVPVSNPAPDLPVHLRQGANLYTNAMVVLDVRTGRLRWHRQMVPNDSHDWDLTHAAPLFSPSGAGPKRQFVATVGKDGVLRTLDRKTQEIVYLAAVTTIENAETPVAITPTRAKPGILGGVQWNGPAYNPLLNMLYVPAVDWGTTFTAFEEPRYIPGKNYLGGRRDMDPPETAQGWVTAVDASTGALKWKYRSARPMVAAVTTTAGNLVLTGELGGDFIALDARDGRELYRFNTGGAMGGGVITYEVGGKQYIAAVSGTSSTRWTAAYGGSPTLVVFAR